MEKLNRMQALIVDSSIIDPYGHPHEWAKRIGRELVNQKAKVQFIVNRKADLNSLSDLSRIGDVEPSLIINESRINYHRISSKDELLFHRKACGELTDLISLRKDTDLFIFPTASSASIEAYGWSETDAEARFILHRDPVIHSSDARVGPSILKRACHRMLENKEFGKLSTPEPELVNRLSTLGLGTPVELLPYPLDKIDRDHRWFKPERKFTIGFFGVQRANKGIQTIQEIIKRTVNYNIQFILHDGRGLLDRRLFQGNVEIVGYQPDLYPFMDRCHVILLPYNRSAYDGHGSGVLMEAAALGIPVVCTSGTIPGKRLKSLGFGELALGDRFGDFWQATKKVIVNYEKYKQAALKTQQHIHAHHGTCKAVEHLMN